MADPIRRSTRAGSPMLAAAVSTALAGAGGAASAQSETALGEVVVTATCRAERLQNVAESISALHTRAIAMRGLQQMDDFAKLIPGLSLGVRELGGTTIVFRGVASSGLQFGAVLPGLAERKQEMHLG